MTDTFVEQTLINKFLELESLEVISKCHKYFQDNKESEECLPAFERWKPDYPEGITEDEKKFIDGPLEYFNEDSLIDWFSSIYPNDYKTETGTEDEDNLYEAIKAVKIELNIDEPIKRKITFFNSNRDSVTVPIYPVVFENLISERSEVSDGFSKAWYELYFSPNAPIIGEIYRDSRRWYTGFLQVNICVPSNTGTDDIRLRYNEIVKHFKGHYLANGIRIENVYRSSNIVESDFTWCPVTIEWKAYLKP